MSRYNSFLGGWMIDEGELGAVGLRHGQFRGSLYEKYHNITSAKLGTKVIFIENKKINYDILQILKC